MRRAIKKIDSEIITQNLKYIEGNSTNNKKIAIILSQEQKSFCAYTDEVITRTDANDVEHFNPKLKGTPEDSYDNWLLVKNLWNKEKASKWDRFQPILNPNDEDFEDRVIYESGDYIAKTESDSEAKNLISLLKLDDAALADNRKKYINRKRDEMAAYDQNAEIFFKNLSEANPTQVSYPRAIREEFGIDILQYL